VGCFKVLIGLYIKIGTANPDDFCHQLLSQVLTPICPFLSPVQSLGTKLGTEWGQRNINDFDDGSSEKLPLCNGFHAILHDDMFEKLTTFLSMSCH